MKKMKKFMAIALSTVMLAGSLAVIPVEAASSRTISRVGSKTRTTYVGKEIELEVREGSAVKDKHMKWSVGNSSILAFENGDRYGDDVDLIAKKAGTTTVKCKNLLTGGSISYTVTVKKTKATYTISRVGSSTRTVEEDDDFELRVKKGTALKSSQIKWTIADTSILRFEDGDNYGTEVELEARKTGTTTVTAHNLYTGGKLVFKIKVVPDYD